MKWEVWVINQEWLTNYRRYFWTALFGIAFLTTLDPTGMALIIIAFSMVVLFEATLFVLKVVSRHLF